MCVHRARIPGQPSAAVQLSSEDLVEAPQQQAAAGSWAARSPQLQPQLSTVARVAAAHGSTEAAYKKGTRCPFFRDPLPCLIPVPCLLANRHGASAARLNGVSLLLIPVTQLILESLPRCMGPCLARVLVVRSLSSLRRQFPIVAVCRQARRAAQGRPLWNDRTIGTSDDTNSRADSPRT